MKATRLVPKRVEKPWGRRDLSPWFDDVPAGGAPVGEIWFEMPGMAADAPELMIKYLFTSERLSIQVHPDDDAARAAGYARGKDEAWLVLDAKPDAEIGFGLTRAASSAELRAMALDGSIEALVDWRTPQTGDLWYSEAGTIHALGPGLAIVEVQQNVDLTYRLYDYGRPRELHLEAGLAVARGVPHVPTAPWRKFIVERVGRGARRTAGACWAVILRGSMLAQDTEMKSSEVWYLDAAADIEVAAGGDVLLAYPRNAVASSSAV
jgi:mannose-6-phosphate isomerase